MGDLTKNFSLWEIECHGDDCCNHSNPMDQTFMIGLQELRDLLGKVIHVNRGFSCRKYNAVIPGSSSTSWHTRGRAADIWVDGKTPEEVFEAAKLIEAFEASGIGIYDNRVHVDNGNRFHRWDKRTKRRK